MSKSLLPASDRRRVPILLVGMVVFALAVLMGFPALKGTFVGGDDHRLVLNHVLVNQPSLAHAAELFTIVHRDLYQPIPLLSFQLEFVVAGWLGLFKESIERGAWLFHFDNMWLHGVNALLVAAVLSMLHRPHAPIGEVIQRKRFHIRKRAARQADLDATTPGHAAAGAASGASPVLPRPNAAEILRCAQNDCSRDFAQNDSWIDSKQVIYSKQVEPAAGIARTTAIAWTAALLFAIHPFNVEVVGWINGRMMLLSTLFGLLSMLAFSRWLDRGEWKAAVATLLLVALSGTSKVRAGLPILLAIVPLGRGYKLDRRFWPVWLLCAAPIGGLVGLNIWTTAEADFFSGGARHLQGPSAVRVLMALAFYFEHFVWPVGLSSYYPAPVQVTWSDPATIRAGLIVAFTLAVMAWASWKWRACLFGSLWFFAGIGDTLPFFPARNILAADRYMYLPIIGLLWIVATIGVAAYRRATSASTRRTPLAPDEGAPGHGNHVPASGRSAFANGLIAICAVVLIPLLVGICWRVAEGYVSAQSQAQRIAQLFPDEPRVWERLGWTYQRAGDYDTAIELARRELRHDAADVRSGAYQLMGLSEIKRGNAEIGLKYLHAAAALDAEAGLAYFRLAQGYEELGRDAEALLYYEKAVADAPQDNPTIRRLARVYRRLDRLDDARDAYEKALHNNRYDVEAALGLVELAIESGRPAELAAVEELLLRLIQDVPGDARLHENLGLVQFLGRAADESMKLAASAFIALTDARYATAAERVERLCAANPASPSAHEAYRAARGWLLGQLERYDQQRPGEAWLFGLSARLLIADRQIEAAKAALSLFESLCRESNCRTYAADLRARMNRT